MGEAVTVRLFVRTRTHDITCDSSQKADWLLEQANAIQQRQRSPFQIKDCDPLQVLYNRTRAQVVDLSQSIGRVAQSMDVIEARSQFNSSSNEMFSWLRSTPVFYPDVSAEKGTETLFFQQLYAFALVGGKEHDTPWQDDCVKSHTRKEADNNQQEAFLDLLKSYVLGSYRGEEGQASHNLCEISPENDCYEPGIEVETSTTRNRSTSYPIDEATQDTTSYLSPISGRRKYSRTFSRDNQTHRTDRDVRKSLDFQLERDYDDPIASRPSRRTSRGYGLSDTANQITNASNNGNIKRTFPQHLPEMSTSPNRILHRKGLDGIEAIFDIVFKQQSIGMKLGVDESKQFAIVRECLKNSEASQYPEIQNGTLILAVNGQELNGLGLSKVLHRLREAPRPVLVRFGSFGKLSNNATKNGSTHKQAFHVSQHAAKHHLARVHVAH